MVKVYIDTGEEYPVHSAAKLDPTLKWQAGVLTELTDEDWADYQLVAEQYESWQEHLHKLVKEATK